MHGHTAWYYARLFTLRKCCNYAFFLSCMILQWVISLHAIEQICKLSRRGKQKSEHTLIMLVMPPLMSANL